MQTYLDELYRWNQRINLTAVPQEEARQRHVGDALLIRAAVEPQPGARVVDVGAGGGVPGLPLAIMRPQVQVTLIDSDQRKCAFLTHVAGLLRLDNVEVLCERAEEVGHREGMRESFDAAVSRALAPPPVMCEWTLPLVRVGGVMAALVGDVEQAKQECIAAAEILGGRRPIARTGGVMVVRKVRPTPDDYPRRAGVPLRKPLV
jgi:16S rRNA (guanine527-N7)-methyltransferase